MTDVKAMHFASVVLASLLVVAAQSAAQAATPADAGTVPKKKVHVVHHHVHHVVHHAHMAHYRHYGYHYGHVTPRHVAHYYRPHRVAYRYYGPAYGAVAPPSYWVPNSRALTTPTDNWVPTAVPPSAYYGTYAAPPPVAPIGANIGGALGGIFGGPPNPYGYGYSGYYAPPGPPPPH